MAVAGVEEGADAEEMTHVAKTTGLGSCHRCDGNQMVGGGSGGERESESESESE